MKGAAHSQLPLQYCCRLLRPRHESQGRWSWSWTCSCRRSGSSLALVAPAAARAWALTHSRTLYDKKVPKPLSTATNTISAPRTYTRSSIITTKTASARLFRTGATPFRAQNRLFHSSSPALLASYSKMAYTGKWTAPVVRKTFLNYFEERGHTVGMLLLQPDDSPIHNHSNHPKPAIP